MPSRSLFAAAVADAAPSTRLSPPLRAARLPRTVARERAKVVAERLARDARVRLIFLFGSAADPGRELVRDLDLAILTRPALTLPELVRLRAEVESGLGVELDLVLLNTASVVLGWEIVRYGECLFAADPDEELDFVTRARSRYWDFQPFLETQEKILGERLRERLHGSTT